MTCWCPCRRKAGLEKLNATFSRAAGSGTDLAAGFRATRQAVARLTGVRVDAGAVLTYPGARELTDAVGGVPVCLPEPVRSVHTERRFPSGCQRLDGAAAVDLLRQRYGLRDGGLDRDRNAARYAAGLLHQMREQGTATDPAQLGRLLLRIGSAVTVDTGDLSLPALVAASGRASRGRAGRGCLPGARRVERSRLRAGPGTHPGAPGRAAGRPAGAVGRRPPGPGHRPAVTRAPDQR